MQLNNGWFRVCVLVSAVWVAGVLGVSLIEYMRQNPFCQFDPADAATGTCLHWFWEWTANSRNDPISLFFNDASSGRRKSL